MRVYGLAMAATKPELADFEITPQEYARYSQPDRDVVEPPEPLGCFIFVGIIAAIVLSIGGRTGDWEAALRWGFVAALPSVFIVALTINRLKAIFLRPIGRARRNEFLSSPVVTRIKLYEQALAIYEAEQTDVRREQEETERVRRENERQRRALVRQQQRQKIEHWQSLDGIGFERELAVLFRALGYQVESTPVSGDQGIDLILRKDGKLAVVQCKAHKNGVGPAVARDLLGTMVGHGAQYAVLACTGGFSRGVYEWVEGKPIWLLSMEEILRLADRAAGRPEMAMETPPTCPKRGCLSMMVLRHGSSGMFWGCPNYPKCKGTRGLEDQ